MSGARPFRFALQVTTATDVATVARAAEDVGHSALQVPDHLGAPDPFVTLGAAASVTQQLRLGTYVLNNEFWPVPLTVRAAANLDVVSGGRFELGIGAGHMQSEFNAAGWTFHPAAQRVAHLEQDARLLRRLLDGETVTAEEDRTTLRDYHQVPPPVQDHLPLLIGGDGDRLLRLAAQVADIVSFVGFRYVPETDDVDLSHFDRAGLDDRLGLVRAAAGERFDELELNLLVQHVEFGADPDEAAERAATTWSRGRMTPAQVRDSPYVLAGSPASICEELEQLRDETGVCYVTVRCLPGTEFDRVIDRLTGG